MSSLKVTLLAHTPDPERVIACAAKLCYSSASIDSLMEGLDGEKTAGFLDMLTEVGHESPVEHTYFTFGIEGVSRSLLAQLTRHRIASYSVKSQRYVKEGAFEFVTPPEIEKNEAARALFLKAMEDDQRTYDELCAILQKEHEERLIASGMEEKEARRAASKLAIEDARFVLPNACETKLVASFNARSLMNFFHKRCCMRAQWEIRELAAAMLRAVLPVAPTLFKRAGPPCINAPCPEGRMSCGDSLGVRAKFIKLKEPGHE